MDETQLAAALRDHDPEAARELVQIHGDRLLRSAFLLCGNESDAEDLVQDTLLQGLSSVQRFRGQSSLSTWLHGILLNLTRHYHRKRKRIIYSDELAEQQPVLPEDTPFRSDLDITSSALMDALGQLSEDHREVIIFRFYEEMKIHEIALRLGISKGTVKSRLHYAISQLQRLLPPEMNLFGTHGTEETQTQ